MNALRAVSPACGMTSKVCAAMDGETRGSDHQVNYRLLSVRRKRRGDVANLVLLSVRREQRGDVANLVLLRDERMCPHCCPYRGGVLLFIVESFPTPVVSTRLRFLAHTARSRPPQQNRKISCFVFPALRPSSFLLALHRASRPPHSMFVPPKSIFLLLFGVYALRVCAGGAWRGRFFATILRSQGRRGGRGGSEGQGSRRRIFQEQKAALVAVVKIWEYRGSR